MSMMNCLSRRQLYRQMVGMTLIELMVTIAILVVLLSVAAPSFQSMIASSSLRTASNELSTSLAQARSDAIRRGKRVTVCKSANGTQCTTTGDWGQGWIIFNDDDHSGTNANVDTSGGVTETITFTVPAQTGGIVIKSSSLNYVSFAADGQPKSMNGAGYFGTIRICSTSDSIANDDRSRDLKLSRTGRSVIEKTAGIAATCPAP